MCSILSSKLIEPPPSPPPQGATLWIDTLYHEDGVWFANSMLYSYLWLPLSSFEPCDEDEGDHSLGQTTPVKDLELHCSLSPHTPPSLPPPSFIWGTQALSNTSSPGLSIHQDTVHGRTEQVAALETTSRALKEQETTRKHSLTLNYAAKEAYAPSARDSSDL